jgi:hypothetical protein
MATFTLVHVAISLAGALSLVALAGALYERYLQRMDGVWRQVYVVTAVTSLYAALA